MKCDNCGSAFQGPGGLVLDCIACGRYPHDCTCGQTGRTPNRWVHCLDCDRMRITEIDTTTSDWRGRVV